MRPLKWSNTAGRADDGREARASDFKPSNQYSRPRRSQAYARRDGRRDAVLLAGSGSIICMGRCEVANGDPLERAAEAQRLFPTSITAYRRMIEQDLRDPIAENLPQAEQLSTLLLGPVMRKYPGRRQVG